MSGYPNSDEEFELMYGDELELLREQDELDNVVAPGKPPSKSRKSLNFSSPTSQKVSSIGSKECNQGEVSQSVGNNIKSQHPNPHDSETLFGSIDDLIEDDLTIANEGNKIDDTVQIGQKKRSIQELFGDIDDLLSEEITGPKLKKYKSKQEKDAALIDHILELRKFAKERENPLAKINKRKTKTAEERNRDNLSYTVPKYPFIGVTRLDGDRVYVRFHSEEYEEMERERITQRNSFVGVMGENFKNVWDEANVLINKALDEETAQISTETNATLPIDQTIDETTSLWVDLYKPRKYWELLSDESTNRILLKWIKLWDKVVFNRRPKIAPVKPGDSNQKFNKFQKIELNTTLDETGRPYHKVALLCGPPGLGKTTLAHLVAKHSGYNVVEINASDDRTVDSFKTALENATQMRSVLDQEKRPNCLVFDEIDGAPQAAIDFLIKFINGTHVPKSKKGKNQKATLLKRPIICICNDVYVPALRPLRQIAFVVNFPPTSSTRLAERLCEIARYQQIKTDMGAMMALSEKTNNDIRSCLSVLHFFKVQDKPVTLSEIYKANVGQKDMQKGLFSVWQDIFQVKRPKLKLIATGSTGGGCNVSGGKEYDMSLNHRMHKVLNTVNSFGDYERVAEGVFENYPLMMYKDSVLSGTSEALSWFCFMDILNKQILSLQIYSLASYLPYAFVMWHFVFGSLEWQKITYPSVSFEVRSKVIKQKAIVSEAMRGMQPSVRTYIQSIALKLDILPLLSQIIVPSFRPVNLHLYTEQEKRQLNQVVSVMIDYNLNYVQERTPEGTYVYNIDPNIDEIIYFPGMKPKRNISYSNKQLISHEIELEKMRRLESQKHKKDKPQTLVSADTSKKAEEQKKELPNHLQRLKPKALKTSNEVIITKDFFGRVITKQPTEGKSGPQLKNDIWYQYKEGYNNAVRKKLKIANLK